jgi:hypothetical protein
MSISDDLKKLEAAIAGINLRLNGIRAGGGGAMTAHDIVGAYHTAAGLTPGYFLKATAANDFDFVPHGLTYTDVGAAPTVHNHDTDYISIIGAPAIDCFPYQTAGGELIDSGYDAASFAAAAHNHDTDYEPALGNPDVDNYVLSSTIAGVRSWIAPGGGVAAFLDLSDVPAAYTGAGGFVVKVAADEEGLEFVAGGAGVSSFIDLDDVPASYAAGDALKVVRVNAAENALEFATPGSGMPPFVDNFDGASIFENWTTFGTASTWRTITQTGGRLKFAADSGQDCSSEIPRIYLPITYYPCVIETKIAAYTKNDRTKVGLFIGPDGHAVSTSGENLYFLQVFSAPDSIDAVAVDRNGAGLASAANGTIPKWLKIICLGAAKYSRWLFYYSTDGTNWTLLYTYSVATTALGGLCAGLFVSNWYNQPAIAAEFEYFKISPYLLEGPG